MAIISSLSWPSLVDHIGSAEKRVCLIMPALHEEWVELLCQCDKSIDISIGLEISETVTRCGYGDARLVERLRDMQVNIKECDKLKIQFLCVDNRGWCIYTESRILAADPEGINAIELSYQQTEDIIREYFGPPGYIDEEPIGKHIDEGKLQDVVQGLEKTPPVSPDMQRQIRVYSNYFQFVEVHRRNLNIENKEIHIPEEELEQWDKKIRERLTSTVSLFNKQEIKGMTELDEIRKAIDQILNQFLLKFPFRENKYILCRSVKLDFEKEVKGLNEMIHTKNKGLKEKINKSVSDIKVLIRTNITEMVKQHKFKKKRQIEIFPEEALIHSVDVIMSSIRFPSAESILEKMELAVHFFDMTEEDISSREIQDWFFEKGLLDRCGCSDLAKHQMAFEEKR